MRLWRQNALIKKFKVKLLFLQLCGCLESNNNPTVAK